MMELENIIARGLAAANLGLSPQQFRTTTARITAEVIAHADEVRAQMEMEVWGMVR
jgi:hypothetical protein